MITARIQIDSGAIEDTYTKWGLIYLNGDKRFAAPEKKRDTTSYVEEAGEHADLRAVDDVFDYKVTFLIDTQNTDLASANAKVAAFNAAIRETMQGSEVKRCKTVTLYDDYKRCKIVGVAEVISEASEYYRRQDGSAMDCVQVELTIHVSDPTLCDFNTKQTTA